MAARGFAGVIVQNGAAAVRVALDPEGLTSLFATLPNEAFQQVLDRSLYCSEGLFQGIGRTGKWCFCIAGRCPVDLCADGNLLLRQLAGE